MKTTFGKQNYLIFLAGIVLIVLGYLLMIGGGSDDPNVFNPAIFDTQRIRIDTARGTIWSMDHVKPSCLFADLLTSIMLELGTRPSLAEGTIE